ncbi:MAG: Uma2 family endonuclease, partial [Microcystis panniformis]
DKETGYNPDLLLINRQNLINEPLWEKKSTLINGESIPLVIEVVSSNWRDDYGDKLVDYEAISIKEYWIVGSSVFVMQWTGVIRDGTLI